MRSAVRFLFLSCTAALVAVQAFAEPVMRAKARLTGFDGTVMQLESLPAPGTKSSGAKSGEAFTASVTPETRYAGTTPSSFSAIKTGDYVGAAVSEQRGGALRAQDIYLYPDALRGTGEGRFPEGERLLVNGAVTAVNPAADGKSGSITIHYRGAVLNNAGPNRTVCEGRASPPAYTSVLACQADASIDVRNDTSISALAIGDKDLLKPGALVTVSMTKAEDGKKTIALGVVVEPPPPGPPKSGVEKPPSSP